MIVYPPSIAHICPTAKPPYSLHSSRTIEAISSARPMRPERDALDDVCHVFGKTGDGMLHHRSVAGAGTDGVDMYSLTGIFQCRAFGQSHDSVLRSRVGADSVRTHQPALRGAVHDGAAALPLHLQQFVFHAVPHTPQVHGDHAVEIRAFQLR